MPACLTWETRDAPMSHLITPLPGNREQPSLQSPGMDPARLRILAATHRDLPLAVREGRFRQDLYFRLNVRPLTLPPLRERTEDLLPLARAFAAELAGPSVPLVLAPGAEEALRAWPWPGNVRELRNYVERQNLLRGGGPRTLPPESLTGAAGLRAAAPARLVLGQKRYREHVDDFERTRLSTAASMRSASPPCDVRPRCCHPTAGLPGWPLHATLHAAPRGNPAWMPRRPGSSTWST